MQTALLIAFSALVLAVAPAQAQTQAQNTGVHFGPKVGMSLAVLDGQINTSAQFKPGLALGAFLRWRPSERIAIQPELVFSQQGTANKLDFRGYTGDSKVKLNYLNIPVLLKIYLGSVVNLQLGPQFGLLLSGRRVGQSGYYSGSNGTGYTTEDVDVKASFKGDVALCGGLGVDLRNGLMASARLNYGLTNIDNDDQSNALRNYLGIGGLHNRVIEFSLGYALGSSK